LANDSVTTVKILNANVTAAKIASDAVTTVKITDANITAAKLASDAVTTVKIQDLAVTGTKRANDTVSTKIASYTLVAADRNTKVVMNAGATNTAITVNTSLFAAGDTLTILNISTSGTCTVTAGTATVASAGSLALGLNQGGTLYFTSAGVSVFQADGIKAASAGTTNWETTTSTIFGDFTVPVAVTLQTGKSAIVIISAVLSNTGVGSVCILSFRVSGATTIASADARSTRKVEFVAGYDSSHASVIFLDGTLTTGSNTFTLTRRVNGATGQFGNYTIAVFPV